METQPANQSNDSTTRLHPNQIRLNSAGPNRSDSSPLVPGTAWDERAERLRQKLPPASAPMIEGYTQWGPWAAIIFGAYGLYLFLGMFQWLHYLGSMPLIG